MNATINAHTHEGPVTWRASLKTGKTSSWFTLAIKQGYAPISAEIHVFKATQEEAVASLRDLRDAIDKALEEVSDA